MSAPTDVNPSPAPKAPIYESSTQFRNWRFSREKLTQIRETLNHAAVSTIRDTFETDQPGSSANVTFLTADEEVLLVKLYIARITRLCHHFRFSEEVEATATTYLKRFYLKNTVMDWHPKNVMLTALFLATKTTNNPISLEEYTARIPNTNPADVLDLEFLVAQSLGFEFAVWHVHRAVWGTWLDIQSVVPNPDQLDRAIYDSALNYVRSSRLTDAELVYAPSQIALAAFSLAQPDLASQWAATKSYGDSTKLLRILSDIKTMISTHGHVPSDEAGREVDRRLKICKNPEKVVGSKAYLAKKTEGERLAEEKRNKKAVEVQAAVENGDPFGTELSQTRRGLVDYDDDDDDDD